jgi:Zinc-binding dehydrogenase
VVIHGAGGAVGSTAVQLARWAGAEVIGTGRSRARALATELGAGRFIALDADGLEDAAGQADLVLDTIGGEVLARSPALLRPGGTLVTIKAAAQPPASRDDIRKVVFVQESSRAQLTELARLIDQGHLRPRSARYTRSRKQPRRTARKPPAASPAGSSSSPDPGATRLSADRRSRPPRLRSRGRRGSRCVVSQSRYCGCGLVTACLCMSVPPTQASRTADMVRWPIFALKLSRV